MPLAWSAQPDQQSRVVPVLRSDPRTGQAVHTIAIAPRPAAVRNNFVNEQKTQELKNLAEEAARRHQVNPDLVMSIMQVESGNNPQAVSPKGAEGVMQLMPATAQRFGVRDAFDPRENIEGGVRYLEFLQQTFGDERLAVAAYNAGEGAVLKYGAVPPYPETRDYVAKVAKKLEARRTGKAQRKLASTASESAVAENQGTSGAQYRALMQYIDPGGRVYLMTQ